jgi:hypothetical protein
MRLIRFDLPLMTLALCFDLVSAAEGFGQDVKGPREVEDPRQRVAASGRLIGTRELQQVVTWQTRGTAYLAVETRGPRPRILWQTDGRNAGSRVDSVRVADLDSNGVPEIMSLWWKRTSVGAELRVFHWDRRQNSFVELQTENELVRVDSYRVVRVAGMGSSSRIVAEMRSGGGARRSTTYELRGTRLIRVGGDPIVTTRGESGIEGQSVISPAHPGPLRQGMPSSAPYKTTLVVWSEDGNREVTRFETGADGRFHVALPPGTYRVGPPPQTGRFLPRGTEETVTVLPGRFVRVTINFDSGMR